MTKNEKIIKILRLTGTIFILEYMDTHTKTQYKDVNKKLAAYTLNCRLQELLDSRKEKREEWYTITERGKKYSTLFKNYKNYQSDKMDLALNGSDYLEEFEKQVNPCFIMYCIKCYHSSDFIMASISFSGIYG